MASRREESMHEAEQARISRERNFRAAEITKKREIEVVGQERQVIVAQKSEEEIRAQASADLARAAATKATEAVIAAREVAESERTKEIALIEAKRTAEASATAIRLAAEAEKEAAADRAEARREEARADADAMTIHADAKKQDMLAEAEGKCAIVEAENARSGELIGMKVDLGRLESLPGIVAEMVEPAEKIGSIKIHQVTGMGGASFGGPASGDKPVVNQALDSIMGMAVQLPALRKLGEDLGLSMEGSLGEISRAGAPGTASKEALSPSDEGVDAPEPATST